MTEKEMREKVRELVEIVPVADLDDILRTITVSARKNGSVAKPPPSSFVRTPISVLRWERTLKLGEVAKGKNFGNEGSRITIEGWSENFRCGFLSDGRSLPIYPGGTVSMYALRERATLEEVCVGLGGDLQTSLSEIWMTLLQDVSLGFQKLTFFSPDIFGMIREVSAVRYRAGWFLLSSETPLRVSDVPVINSRWALPRLRKVVVLEEGQVVVSRKYPPSVLPPLR